MRSSHEALSTLGDIDYSTKAVAYQCEELRTAIAEYKPTIATHSNAHSIQQQYITAVTQWLQSDDTTYIRGLEQFPYVYVINGISQAIDSLHFEDRRLHIHPNEYRPYQVVGNKASIDDTLHIISQPFSQLGSISEHSSKIITSMPNVWVDAAYFGTNNKLQLTLDENVETLVYSFSKSFGLQYSRIGIMYTKNQVPLFEMYKHYAYNNINAAALVLNLIDRFAPSYFPNKLQPHQQSICDQYGLEPLDCVWVGLDKKKGRKVSLFPYYEQMQL